MVRTLFFSLEGVKSIEGQHIFTNELVCSLQANHLFLCSVASLGGAKDFSLLLAVPVRNQIASAI